MKIFVNFLFRLLGLRRGFDSSISHGRMISILVGMTIPITNWPAVRIMARSSSSTSSPLLKKRREPNTRKVRHVHKFTTRRGGVEYFYLSLLPLPFLPRCVCIYIDEQGGCRNEPNRINARGVKGVNCRPLPTSKVRNV